MTSGPLPERGSRVDLTGLAGGSWTAVVERSGDGVIILTAPDASDPLPPPVRRLIMNYPARGVPWEVDVDLLATPPGADDATRPARLASEPHQARRRAVRVPVRVAVAARLEGGGDGVVLVAFTENVSTAGALLATEEAVEVGRTLRMWLCGGGDGDSALAGRVVRCDFHPGRERPWRVAVAFADLDDDEEDRLRRFLIDRERPGNGGSGGPVR